jgi:hypothetical protein
MTHQLVLSDRTLRVLDAVLPHGHVANQVHAARDPYPAGRLSFGDVGLLADALVTAFYGGEIVVSLDALVGARREFEHACRCLGDAPMLASDFVSLYVWDPERDGPLAPHGDI